MTSEYQFLNVLETGWDVAVVGGGPAGSVLAASLARRGRRVVLFEKDRFPRAKLCGEFLSGDAARHLDELGCLDAVLASGPARIFGARLTTPSGSTLEVELPGGAFGVSRRVLDQVLLRHAVHAGATVLEAATVGSVRFRGGGTTPRPTDPGGAEVEVSLQSEESEESGEEAARNGTLKGTIRAELAVGAHGRRSSLDHRLERSFLSRSYPFVGFSRHHRLLAGTAGRKLAEELNGFVEVHTFDGGYCGMSFIEGREVNVCMLLDERFLKALPSPRWFQLREALGRIHPLLRRRFDALETSDETVHAVARVPCACKGTSAGAMLLVGDAAGMIPPFCGDGQAMALESALLLSDRIAKKTGQEISANFADLARCWDRDWRSRFGFRMKLAQALQQVLLRQRPAAIGLRIVKAVPGLAALLVGATRGR